MKSTFGDKLFYAFNYAVLTLIGLSCLFPLLHIVALSLSEAHAVDSGRVSVVPVGWATASYKALFDNTRILPAFWNSLEITVVGTALSMAATVLTAYPLSRAFFYGRRPLTLAMVFTMLFGSGLIPNYLVMSQYGLINSYWVLWLPALINTFNVLVMRTFFEGIPGEIEEAARIDGCGEWTHLFRVVLPLSLPVLATITLFNAVGFWNAFMNVLIYINETRKYNLTVLVQQMIRRDSILAGVMSADPGDIANVTNEGIKAAGIMVMIVPMLLIYPFLQKYFVKGVMLGAVKG
ncbi:carbohydrate ABC transporter permease [Paenibacillus glycinis]|uniref:ABC transporter permease subunit n=1 Tax=Paenibacillus glycinis TaxID=2697035 RepID=A0ABW9XPV7_9BACL|nr:carbohydrate ABC transporter permease [Paenibacillus glycinis]NBD24683.1 ABC transporter permease subunit [Paenibacillus glycinis]